MEPFSIEAGKSLPTILVKPAKEGKDGKCSHPQWGLTRTGRCRREEPKFLKEGNQCSADQVLSDKNRCKGPSTVEKSCPLPGQIRDPKSHRCRKSKNILKRKSIGSKTRSQIANEIKRRELLKIEKKLEENRREIESLERQQNELARKGKSVINKFVASQTQTKAKSRKSPTMTQAERDAIQLLEKAKKAERLRRERRRLGLSV